MEGAGEAEEWLKDEFEAPQTRRKQTSEALTGSGNRLSTLTKTIIDSNYSSTEEPVAASETCSIGEIHAFLNPIIVAWRANQITPAAMYRLLKFVYLYLEQLFLNRSIGKQVIFQQV